MSQPVPKPVLGFFARFVKSPDDEGLRKFCIDLLDLEVSRAQYNVFSNPPLVGASADYRSDIVRADCALNASRRNLWPSYEYLDLPSHWLTLLGHRLATERGFPEEGSAILAHVASVRLDLPLKETESWPGTRFFWQYTKTVLRDEWDYVGLQFRMHVNTSPPEAT